MIGPNRSCRNNIRCCGRGLRKNRRVDDFRRRLVGRSRPIWNSRNAIPAACPRQVLAVGQKSLAFVQRDLFLGPKNLVAQAVGDVNLPLSCQPHHVGGLHMKIRVMCRGHRVVLQCRPKLLCAGCPAGNHRVGINRSVRVSLHLGVRRRKVRIAPEWSQSRRFR
jgi:hypothetical protein